MKRSTQLTAGLVLAAVCGATWAQGSSTEPRTDTRTDSRIDSRSDRATERDTRRLGEAARNARNQVSAATGVVRNMERDTPVAALLADAAGVFIVPRYTRAALGIGARGGEGVLLARNGGAWSDPVFFNLAGVSVGAQAGIEGGEMALILRTPRALERFRNENNWSLNADAGLTIVNWSRAAEASARAGDVVVWSARQGLFGELAVSVTDIHFDRDENAAFYGRPIATQDVLTGRVSAAQATRETAGLKQALAAVGRNAAPGGTMGGSGSGANPERERRGNRSDNRSNQDAGQGNMYRNP